MSNNKKFYVIATPIGNLQEVNIRIEETLKKCDYLFCEDTRITQKFLNLIKLSLPKTKLISYHKFNEKTKLDNLLNLVNNFTCGIISDAGYPTISDPGLIIISEIRKRFSNINIEVINCSSAAICALVGSGFNTKNFYFYGFLSKNENELKNELNYLKKIKTTIILFESVHRIATTLNLIGQVFINEKICVARELTKKNETYYFGLATDLSEQITLKGEFVILIDNNIIAKNIESDFEEDHLKDVKELVKLGLRLKDACKFVAKKNNLIVSKLYDFFQKEKN